MRAVTLQIALVFLAFVAGGCGGGTYLDGTTDGRPRVFEPGVPNFDLLAAPALRDGRPGLDCLVGIPPISLVFAPEGVHYEARVETLFRLMDERGKTVLSETVRLDTLRVDGYEATQSHTAAVQQVWLDAAPGTYLLDVVLTDVRSRQEVRRRQRVRVLPADGPPHLGSLRLEMERPGDETYVPVLARYLPAGEGTLRATATLYHARRLGQAHVAVRLLRFPSDTAAAQPPYRLLVNTAYDRVRYDRPDTLHHARRRLSASSAHAALAFDLPALAEGLYRLEMTAEAAAGGASLTEHYDFAVYHAGFPRVTSLDVMIEALAYLSQPGELGALRDVSDPAQRIRRFDAFWGRLISDRSLAASTLKRYYSRVEEANFAYTTYKAGWKTDRGMIYIILGTPLFIDRHVDREVWYYSYDDRDDARNFVFERRLFYASNGLFETYILERGPGLQHVWQRALQRWRRGEVL